MTDQFIVEKIRKKIGVLERRKAHLDRRIGDPERRAQSVEYDKEESAALGAAILGLKYHEASVRPETSPVLALRDLLEELTNLELPSYIEEHRQLLRAVNKAHMVLDDLS